MNEFTKLIQKYWKKLINFTEEINKVYVVLLLLATIFLYSRDKFIQPLVDLFTQHWQLIATFIVGIVIVYILIQVQRLNRRFTVGFQDKFRDPLNKNWNYLGDWKIESRNELSVSGSDSGGITNVGSLWENYTFEFETKILNKCSSWVVRATDLNSYVMFQCTDKLIRPHLRLKLPKVTKEQEDGKIVFIEQIGWITDTPPFDGQPHNKKLNGWFKVKIICKGTRVDIFINNDNIYHSDNVLTIPIGKVGFRNFGDEHAHFRNVKVTLN